MGLCIQVGVLSNSDIEGYEAELEQINKLLTSKGIPEHVEPRDIELFDFDVGGYRMLHYLRRVAAHLDLRGSLPPPGPPYNASGRRLADDPVLQEYYKKVKGNRGFLDGLFGKSKPRRGTFDHLIEHSDCEGYYLPMDFETVIYSPSELNIAGQIVGSSVRLRDECKRIAEHLQLPLDMDPNDERVFAAGETQGEGGALWERYGIESAICLQLFSAAEYSVNNKAMIVFG